MLNKKLGFEAIAERLCNDMDITVSAYLSMILSLSFKTCRGILKVLQSCKNILPPLDSHSEDTY